MTMSAARPDSADAPSVGLSSIIYGHRGPEEATAWIDGEPLDWRSSLDVRRHSPAGIEWGYAGSGPSQFALAILLALTDRDTAEANYQNFKRAFIVGLQADMWVIPVKDVLAWLRSQSGDDTP